MYIFAGSLIIGALHGLIAISLSIFITWAFIGAWICFTIKFFERLKYARELNSPQNTSFFLLAPLFIGLIYNFWGYYTGFLGQNLLEDVNIYLSPWVLIFALPYLLYSLYAVYSCLSKYDVAYIGTKSVNAFKFGIFIALLWVIAGVLNPIAFVIINEILIIAPARIYFDLILIILSIISLFLLIVYGIIGRRESLPEISRDLIARRRSRIENLQSAQPAVQRTRPTTTSRTSSRSRTRRTPRGTTQRTTRRTTTKTKSSQKTTSRTSRSRTPTKTIKLGSIVPKAGMISEDDFMCIFCFRLPKLPEDRNRGIVVCPHCRHPAHADEFRDWTRSSNLCSRCDTPFSPSFIRNPRVIPVNVYLKAMEKILKKRK